MSTNLVESIESLSLGDVSRNVTRRSRTALGVGRDLYRAGLGVVATAQQETVAAKNMLAERYEMLVARGTIVDVKSMQAVEDLRNGVAARAQMAVGRVDDMVVRPVTNATAMVAKRMGIPTRDEVRGLAANVANLSAKVDALVAKLGDAPVVIAEPTVTVLASDEGWTVEIEGTSRPLSVHGTKDEAVEAARAIATERAPSHLIVYKKDGTIQDKVSYHA
jgi:hypothetical protein